jgi:acylphosphatase
MGECRHFRVRGRVQGVFYRAATQERAMQLGLTGWVRNADNGDVELVACGDPTSLEQLEQWLRQGPPAARVSAVQGQVVPVQNYADFEIRR